MYPDQTRVYARSSAISVTQPVEPLGLEARAPAPSRAVVRSPAPRCHQADGAEPDDRDATGRVIHEDLTPGVDHGAIRHGGDAICRGGIQRDTR
jgi:hypothetical protein